MAPICLSIVVSLPSVHTLGVFDPNRRRERPRGRPPPNRPSTQNGRDSWGVHRITGPAMLSCVPPTHICVVIPRPEFGCRKNSGRTSNIS
ncbi:hypothetical protein EDD16DRAFT_1541437 [Pisolithus croceorrhizus]|nr:hypothetical protein EDD16DRAFT_1541437 [Pisolithus croceorrhizus]KAI6135086.1 hypothetical protein EV401DRAFT_1902577 [Pisolithus croceorrhizus]